MRAAPLLLLGLLGCTRAPKDVAVHPEPGGFDVRADAPITWVEVRDRAGTALARRRLPAPLEDVWVDLPWDPGAEYVVAVRGERGELEIPVTAPVSRGPVAIALQAPLGQDARAIEGGERLEVAVIEGGDVQVAIVLRAVVAGTVTVRIGAETHTVRLQVPGERRTVVTRVSAPVPVLVDAGDRTVAFELVPVPIARAQAVRDLAVTDVIFPADASGGRDLARPAGRVTLPARWWEELLRSLSLGFRPGDGQAPWALEAITVRNAGAAPLNVVLSTRVLDEAGRPVHAFRPRLREADGDVGYVSALLRVPATGEATAVVPLFVDRGEVEPGRYERELTLTPLGATEALSVRKDALYVSRGSTWASVGFAGSMAASASGLLWLGLGLRRWLGRWSTSDLTTIALFGSLQFVVGVAAQIVATVAVTLVGPFSPMLTGLVDDAFRSALMATLVTLLPRPGTVSLSIVLGYLLRVLALGSFSPVDAIWLGASVAWLELCLWLTGLTRSGSWRDGAAWRRWIRLSAGLGAASVLSAATALVVHVLLYRLFYASWYVGMVLALPSFLYVLVACAIAVPFADSLRRVES